MRGLIFILIVLKSGLCDPDYADLGGHVLSDDIHLQHEIDAHYTNVIDTGEQMYSLEKKDPRKFAVDKDTSHGVRHLLKNYNDLQVALTRPENAMRDSVFMQHFHDVAGTDLRQVKSEPDNTIPSEVTLEPAEDDANLVAETEDLALPVFDEHHMISPGGPAVHNGEPENEAGTDEAPQQHDGHTDGHTHPHDHNDEDQPTEGDDQTIDIDETIGDDEKDEDASFTDVPVNVHNTKPVFDEHHQINAADEGMDHSGVSTVPNEENEDQIMDDNDDEGDDDDDDEQDENDGRDGRIVNRSGQKRNRNRAGGATRIRSRPSAEDSFRPRPVYTEPVASGPIHSTHSHSEHHINHVENTNIITTGSRQDAAMKIMSDVDQACYDPVTCAVKDTKVEVNILIQKDPVIREEIIKKEAEEDLQEDDTDDSESDSLLAWLFG